MSTMDDVDLGDALPLAPPPPVRDETTDSSGSHSDDDYDDRDDHDDDLDLTERAPTAPEGLSQRLRGSLQRRVTPLVGNLRHSIATSTGVDATTSRLRSAMQRMRGHASNDNQAAEDHNGHGPNHVDADVDEDAVLRKSGSASALRASLAAAGLALVHEHKLVLLGHVPLVQPQDDVLFLERPVDAGHTAATPWTMKRGEFVRVQCPDNRAQSWLCQLACDKPSADADVLQLAAPFPGPLLPDAVVHYVPHECLPAQLTDAPPDASDAAAAVSDSEEDGVADLRSSLDVWRPSMDDADVSTDDETVGSSAGFASSATRASVARDKAAAFYETLKTRKSRLRTSSADYKDKLKSSKERLAAAGQVSKEKLASVVSKEKLAAAGQVSKEKLAVASQVSKEKLAVASQASKEKLAVAGQASKLKVQSWTSSAKSSFKAKMAQRAEQRAAAAAAASGPEGLTTAAAVVDPDVFTIEDNDDDDDSLDNNRNHHPATTKAPWRVGDVSAEEAQLFRELDDC